MDRYNRAKESDKSLHTLPGLLFSLYMTGRLQPDTTGQQDCKSPIQPISLHIFSPALTLCLLTLYYKCPLMGQAAMHCASTECNPDTSSKVPFKASAIPERSMHWYFQPDCLPFRETLKWHFPRQIYRGGVHIPTNKIFPNIESWQYPCRSP